METISLKEMPKEAKIMLLKALGLGLDDNGYIIDSKGKRITDKYTDKQITLQNLGGILPSHSKMPIIIEDGLFSMISYSVEFPEFMN